MNIFRGADPILLPGNWAALPLRIITGLIFIYYGFDKLFGNGQWTGMNAAFFAAVGLPFPEWNAMAVGALELFGGLSILAGVMVKFFSLQLAGSMMVALITVGDLRLEGTLLAVCVALLLFGAGPLSLDLVLARLRLPRPLQRLFRADADPFWRPAGLGATPLRLMMGLLFIGNGIAQLFVNSPTTGANAGTLTMVLGALQLLAGLAVLVGMLTKVAAALLLLITLVQSVMDNTLLGFPGALLSFFTQGSTSGLAPFFVLLPVLASLLAILLVGAGPLSLDYMVQRTLAAHPGRSDAESAVSYGG